MTKTLTPTPSGTVANVAALATLAPRVDTNGDAVELCTVDELRDAVAAHALATTDKERATVSLASKVLGRYIARASRYFVTKDGVVVIPESDRDEVRAMVWLDATGRTTAPTGDDKTSTTTSIGQYVSQFGTVATNLAYGIQYLTGPGAAKDAYKSISDDKNKAKAADKAKRDALAIIAEGDAYRAFLANVSESMRDAFALVTDTLTQPIGRKHAAAFVATLASTNGVVAGEPTF
jgi:hypothetical protein